MKHTSLSVPVLRERAQQWQEHEFYSAKSNKIVLGLDIGLDGIGIYLRHGPKEIFARTLDFELPEPEALANRRQKRAWRHCRKNRATRMRRLKRLFELHGLPWLPEQSMSRARPFRERHRAMTTGVASPEALSICIRHCVMHRGFDYGGTEEGRFPWGESCQISAARTWLSTAVITAELAKELEEKAEELTAKKNPEVQKQSFIELIHERLAWSKEHNIERVLEEHSKGGHDNFRFRARGFNFPRETVWEHLENIIRRHSRLVRDADGFIAALGLDPNRESNEKSAAKVRKRAIFFYSRKTLFDMERHWAKKVNVCPYAQGLDLPNPEVRCDLKENLEVRRWSILEFAVTRRVELDVSEGKGKTKEKRKLLHRLSAATIKALVEFTERHYAAIQRNDKDAEPHRQDISDLIGADIASTHGEKAKPLPQSRSDWNKSFYGQLWDLMLPTAANRKRRASLCSDSAAKLFAIATENGRDFEPEKVTARLGAIGFYDRRRDPGADFNPYPQVECLLGKRIKHGKQAGELSPSHQGQLRRIFAQFKSELDEAAAPDFCIIEVIGDPPRNTEQRREREQEMKQRRSERDKQFDQYDLEDSGIASKRRRIEFYRQQRGRCPFTGEPLPANPLDPDLELEHLFPEERGGLSMDENLALTWRAVNAAKSKRTPIEASEAGLTARLNGRTVRILARDALLKNVSDMQWGGKKREIFGWGTNREEHYDSRGILKVPAFGNTTRVAQLARQLRAEVARWMGVEKSPDEAARRIGTPSGWLAAQARKSWLEAEDYLKIRSNLVHHLIDAAVLAHIPPREGMNHVSCGGIFFTEWESVRDEATGKTTYRLLTKALPELSPARSLRQWLSDRAEYGLCPVFKLRSGSKAKSLGDDTFWRQVKAGEPTLAQRTVLDAAKIGSAEELLATLQRMGVDRNGLDTKTGSNIPSRAQVARWLDAKTDFAEGRSKTDPGPLKLNDGTPVKNIWKFDSKGSLAKPLGWSGSHNAHGKLQSLRNLSLRYDRIEIWLGYNHDAAERARKKKNPNWTLEGWTYQRRLIPDRRALTHLKQLGFYFGRDNRRPAPEFMQEGNRETRTLREIILGGKLLPFSVRMPVAVRKGDLFLLPLNKDGEIVEDGSKPYWTNWYRVTATGTVVEMKSAVLKPGGQFVLPAGLKESMLTRKAARADLIAFLAGLPAAAEQAAKLKLRIPVRPTIASAKSVPEIGQAPQMRIPLPPSGGLYDQPPNPPQ